MDTKTLIESLTSAAKLVAPLIPGGGAAVEIAENLLKAIRATGSSDPEVRETRAELEAAVNAHADRTAASLS